MWDAAWMSTILGNLRFPDDITLTGVDRSGEYGMEISTQKTIVTVSSCQTSKVKIEMNGEQLEEVRSFKHVCVRSSLL